MYLKTLLSRDWNTAGALVNPNGMTRYSQCPVGVLKAVFYLSPSRNPLGSEPGGKRSEIQLSKDGSALQEFKGGSHKGSGYQFLIMILLTPR